MENLPPIPELTYPLTEEQAELVAQFQQLTPAQVAAAIAWIERIIISFEGDLESSNVAISEFATQIVIAGLQYRQILREGHPG